MKLKNILAIFSMLTIFSSHGIAADFVLIVNKANTTSSIPKQDVKKIFLGKKTTWDDGSKIELLVQSNSPVHKPFVKSMVGKNPMQFEMFWKKAVFTGTGTPPVELTDAKAVKEAVSTRVGAISFIPGDKLDKTVKTINIQ